MASFEENVTAALKDFYDGQKIGNSLFRNSPLLGRIKKKRVGGRVYPVPFLTSGSGASCGDMTQFLARVGTWGRTKQMRVDYGNMFGGFTLSLKEMQASNKDAGSFVDLLTLKSFASLESLRKIFAIALFGDGTGYLGKLSSSTAAGATTLTVPNSVVLGLGVGTQITLEDTSNSSKTELQVTKIKTGDSTSVLTVAVVGSGSVPAVTAANSKISISGCVDSNGKPLLPIGLEGWLPSIADRNGAAWNSYIATPFFEVDRSDYVSRLAGQFVKRDGANNETYTDALIRMLEKIRTQGGNPDLIVLNPADYGKLMQECKTQLNYMQQINGPNKKDKNEVTKGISAMSFAFSTSWLENVIDDPFCPEGKAYILDESCVQFVALSNTDKLVTPGTNSTLPGAPEVTETAKAPDNYIFNYDDFISTQPTNTQEGSALLVVEQVFGNFVITNPAHCGVVAF